MRRFSPALTEALEKDVTTLCQCWILTRRDGVILRLTDHDADLAIGAVTFEAMRGVEAGAIEGASGLAIGGGEIRGALESARIEPADIVAGRYDDARIDAYLVDWRAPALSDLLFSATLGEIRRAEGVFIAELRDPLHPLDQEQGRVYARECSAELGDSRCGVALDQPAFRASGAIGATDGVSRVTLPQAASAPAGLFVQGRLRFTSGANSGLVFPIQSQEPDGTLHLWQSLPSPAVPGDTVIATAGCDKRFATCRGRFQNTANFRGFPHIPSPDFILRYAREGEGTHQGRPLIP